MLARVRGILEQLDDHSALLWVGDANGHGVGHEVLLPAFTAAALRAQLGETVTLHTLQFFEPSSASGNITPRLVGFTTHEHRVFFRLFTTVKGVGPRKALRALTIPPAEVASAIARRDTAALVALPEIGKRTAETIIAELSGKVDDLALAPEPGATPTPAPAPPDALPPDADRAVAALVRLGESRAEAQRLVRRVIEAKPEADTADAILAAAVTLR